MIGEPRLPDTVQTIAETLAFWAERTPQAPALVTSPTPNRGRLRIMSRPGR